MSTLKTVVGNIILGLMFAGLMLCLSMIVISCKEDSPCPPAPKSTRVSAGSPQAVPNAYLTTLGMPTIDWDDEGLTGPPNVTTLTIPASWDGKRVRIQGACVWSDQGSVGQRTLTLYSPDRAEFDIQTLPPDAYEFHGNKVAWIGIARAGWRILLQAYQTSGQTAYATPWLFVERMN